MEQQLQEIREQQKASWNKSSSGWKKWDELTMDFLRPFGDEIIERLNPKGSDLILDVAAGTGEPGLTIASKLNTGKVIITDLADDMLVIAHENATKAGVKNVEFSACDVTELPFDDNSFDGISCRMGFMFFPDMLLAVKEMVRVLKPGGTIAASVWTGPEKNFWFTGVMSVVKKYVDIPPPPSGAPGMFRCAQEGLMAGLFAQAELKNIVQKELSSALKCGNGATYWSLMSEVAGPVVTALNSADAELREKIKNETIELIDQQYPEGNVKIECNALVISGEK